MKQVVEKGRQRAVDMSVLTAGMAEIARQGGSAVQAVALMRVPVRTDLARLGLDRAPDHRARNDLADCFEFTHQLPP
jgi:hypothetical protein